MSFDGLIYDADFIDRKARRELRAWLADQHPLWEDRHVAGRTAREGQKRRRLLRPVIWLGGWQFACLNYYRTGHERHRVVEAEPFPAALVPLVARMETLARQRYAPADMPEGWCLNTCLINFYGLTLRDGKWVDTARVGSHRDHEPGPVGSLSLGAPGRFEFTTGREAGNEIVLKRDLGNGSMLLFGTPRWKDELHHRVVSVARQGDHTFDTEIEGFRLRRVNFTFRYVPPEYIHPYHSLPQAQREDVAGYMKTLARTSPFFAQALSDSEATAMPKTTIQRLVPGESERLREIRLEALRDAPDAFGGTLEESQQRSLDVWSRQLEELPTFVAVQGGVDVGMVRLAPHDAREDTAFLLSMWVAPQARGQGIGADLVDRIVDHARAAGFTRIVLDVADQNSAAIALYARKGFEPTGATGALPPPRVHIIEHERELIIEPPCG